jgi:hypothetical protein
MKTIKMIHEDGSSITIQRNASEIERTIDFARQCGYIRFEIS